MHPEFTADELREIHDALARYVLHMIEVGQTPQEIGYQSLATAWSAQQKIVACLLPGKPPEWVQTRDTQVSEAINHPKRLPESSQT